MSPFPFSYDPMNKSQTIIETLLPTLAGMFLAAQATTDASTIMGACIAGSGIMSILGMLLSEVIPTMSIPRLTGAKRMLANWLCGLFAIPFVPAIHRHWFPNDDLALTAGGIAGVFALLGVSFFTIVIPRLLKVLSRGAASAEETASSWIPNRTKTKRLEEKPGTETAKLGNEKDYDVR